MTNEEIKKTRAQLEGTEKKQLAEFYFRKKGQIEKREGLQEQEKLIREQLEQELKMMKLDPGLAVQAAEKAEEIKSLDESGKLKALLRLAQEQGLAFAVETAQKTNDAALLDYFHDILAKDGFYKKLPR